MRITFLLPDYVWVPSGGCKVVYEYANRLVCRGHQVTVVHPRRLKHAALVRTGSLASRLRGNIKRLLDFVAEPKVNWHSVDSRVRLLYVPNPSAAYIPEGDAVFATAWHTVRSVLTYPPTKGEKFYLVQGYETWQGPKEQVDETWRSQLHKVVVAKWLFEMGTKLGCADMVYVPNAVDHRRYACLRPIADRPRQVAMMYSPVPVKGSADGIEAIRLCREKHSDIKIICFGTSRRPGWIPQWIEYHRNPPQQFIVDEIYNGSRIFLSSSWSEGFALPAAEAAACGCAIVSTDSLGVREFVQDGASGLLSPPKNPAALANNLCRLLGDDDLRIRFAEAANTTAAGLDWERSTDLLEDFIKRKCSQRANP